MTIKCVEENDAAEYMAKLSEELFCKSKVTVVGESKERMSKIT